MRSDSRLAISLGSSSARTGRGPIGPIQMDSTSSFVTYEGCHDQRRSGARLKRDGAGAVSRTLNLGITRRLTVLVMTGQQMAGRVWPGTIVEVELRSRARASCDG